MASSHQQIYRTSLLSTTLDRTLCDMLVIWDRPTEQNTQPKLVELVGQATNWERIPMVQEDDVLRGTYFHMLLKNMPVGIELRMKFRVDGVHTVDDRYATEPDDGFGDKNNLLYIDPKTLKRKKIKPPPGMDSPTNTRGDPVVFPIAVPFVGWALEAEQRNDTSLESAALPQDMITTTRLYHKFMYMNKQKEKYPDMSWDDIKQKTELVKVSKQKSKKLSKMDRALSTSSSSSFSSSSSSSMSARHFGGQEGSRSGARSSVNGMASSASLHSAGSVRRSTGQRRHPMGESTGTGGHHSLGGGGSSGETRVGSKKRTKKKRGPPTTQAGTLTYCQGLSIYELESRMSAVVKESRMVASKGHGKTRRTRNRKYK
jgi:hypothetical protein